jgi:RimJ/RimL family protein N-acetyltransferase
MIFETDRLVIEPLTAGHADALEGLLDERVNRYFLPEDVPASLVALRGQFEEMEAAAVKGYRGSRFLPFVAKHLAEGDYIGRLEALVHGTDAEIAFLLVPRSWGQGFASEATAGLISELRVMGVERVWACVAPDNEPSLAMCRRLKFERVDLPVQWSLATYDDGDIVLALRT